MSQRQWLSDALDGLVPERTPYSFYSWMLGGDALLSDEWKALYDRGLAISHHVSTVGHTEHGVEYSQRERRDGDTVYHTYRIETPVGALERTTRNGWHHEDWIKTPADYKTRRWMIENTELAACYENFDAGEDLIGDRGVCVVTGSRTPAMSINVDWAGTEQFCMDVAMEVPELFDLYEAQKKLWIEEARLIAAGPGKYVKWLENLTISMLGPKRYQELLVNCYDEAGPLMRESGKRTMVHYDGELRCIKDEIAASSLDMIESLTEPPEGDMMYDQARAAWPDMVLWGNLNIDLYYGPLDALRQAVIDKRNRAGKRGFAFEISEDMPPNWRDVIPVVLDTLEELG